LIEETCLVVDERSCNVLKTSAEAGKSLEELNNLASTFERVAK
jgi:hypothetical protein